MNERQFPEGIDPRDENSPHADRTEHIPTQGGAPESSWTSPSTYRHPAEQSPQYSGYGHQHQRYGVPQHEAHPTQPRPAFAGAPFGGGYLGAQHGPAQPGAQQAQAVHQTTTGAFQAPEPSYLRTAESHRHKGPGWPGVIATTLAGAMLASGLTFAAVQGDGSLVPSATSASSVQQVKPVTTSTTDRPDWAAVASAVSPSVVAIRAATSSGGAEGSGVIYDESGHVVTNEHVVAGARDNGIVVTTFDGQMIPATVVGIDPATDLAVLKLEQTPSAAKAAVFGDSSTVVVGDPVVAIGNPLGLSSTVTTGIVSALDRPVSPQDPSVPNPGGLVTNAIQVDASINPGNSGGPLFDAEGRVIGINSSIATTSQNSGSVGLGFAIPSNLVDRVVPQLIQNGRAEHAFLGVSMQDGTATVDGITRAGASIVRLESGQPAADAGLRTGDVIVGIDGKTVGSAEALTGYVRTYSSGDKVTISYVRGGKENQVEVTLATRPDNL